MKDPDKDPNKDPKKWGIGIGALILMYLLFNALAPEPPSRTEHGEANVKPYAYVLKAVKEEKVTAVVFGHDTAGNEIVTIERDGGYPTVAGAPPGGWEEIKHEAVSRNIEIDGTYKAPVKLDQASGGNLLLALFMNFAPIILILGVMIYFMNKNNPMNNKKAANPKHRMYEKGTIKENFESFAGNEEAKEDVKDIVEFLQDPKALIEMGGRVPKGALMVGPPGNGKTLLARCIAGEAGVPFFFISGSDFVEMYVGVGAARVRALFEDAAKHAPCIIFIDEIDAVGRQRGAGMGGGNDEREQTLNQLLVELDGFDQKLGIFVIAATNRPDVLDEALKRSGRLTRTINVEAPDLHARKLILKVHGKGKKFGKDVDFDHIANSTWGFSGADLEELLDRAVILMSRRVKTAAKNNIKQDFIVSAEDVEQAIMEGSMKAVMAKSAARRQDPAIKVMLAYHEGGHGVVTEHGYQRFIASGREWKMRWGNALRRLTIVGAANTGGHMQATPDDSSPVETFESLVGQIASLVGATIAERLYTGTASTGNSNDLKRAYHMAKAMVTKVGMSALGPISVGEDTENPNLGRVVGSGGGGAYGLSNESSDQIDKEIGRILAGASRIAIRALKEREDFLHALVKELVVKETIARAEWLELWDAHPSRVISDLEVERELSRLWPAMAKLSGRTDCGVAIIDGECTVLDKPRS
jgi:cell division protease FtsH